MKLTPLQREWTTVLLVLVPYTVIVAALLYGAAKAILAVMP